MHSNFVFVSIRKFNELILLAFLILFTNTMTAIADSGWDPNVYMNLGDGIWCTFNTSHDYYAGVNPQACIGYDFTDACISETNPKCEYRDCINTFSSVSNPGQLRSELYPSSPTHPINHH